MFWLPQVVNFWVGWWQIILNGSGNSYLSSEKIATIDACVRFIELIISLIVQASFPRAFVILQVIRVIVTPTWWSKLVKLIPQIYWDRRGQPHGKQWSPWSGFLHDLIWKRWKSDYCEWQFAEISLVASVKFEDETKADKYGVYQTASVNTVISVVKLICHLAVNVN